MSKPRDIYDVLAQWRHGLRGFLRFSQKTCRAHGATPATYQLMLVLKSARKPVDIQAIANAMSLAHHSAAELVQKAEAAGHVRREPDPADARRSMISMTPSGDEAIAALAQAHGAYLARIRPQALDVLRELDAFL